MNQHSVYVTVCEHRLHLKHIAKDNQGPAVLCIHGIIENGRIFYTDSGKGLACFLAEQGFQVYVADLRGRGLSEPSTRENQAHGMRECIECDIPALIKFVADRHHGKIHLVAHSWGGVLVSSVLARYPQLTQRIASQVYFGVKRSIEINTWRKRFVIDLLWHNVAPFIARWRGYFPADKMNVGADVETLNFMREVRAC